MIHRLIFLLLVLSGGLSLPGQTPSSDLFDQKNSEQFARYLILSKQYDFAAIEYERLYFMGTQNDTARFNLLKSYRLSEKPQTAVVRYFQMYPTGMPSPEFITGEVCKSFLTAQDYQGLAGFMTTNGTLSFTDKGRFTLGYTFLSGNTRNMESIYQDYPFLVGSKYAGVIQTSLLVKYKKPWLAGGMSAVIPGLGKVYAGKWKDGLFSAIMVGALGWRTYRFFDKKGINSYAGWIFGSVTAGFYLGNV